MIFTSAAALALITSLASATPVNRARFTKRATNQLIQGQDSGLCLSLRDGSTPGNGVLLGTRPCKDATHWDVEPFAGGPQGSIKISVGGNFALDAGVPQGNGNPAKIWQSFPTSPQQTWVITGDNKIAVWNGDQCLQDAPGQPRTWQCGDYAYQKWNIIDDSPPPASSSIPPVPMPTPLVQIYALASENDCATVQGNLNEGTPVVMSACVSQADPVGAANQLWSVTDNGHIRLRNTSFCLDAGENPSNGVAMKLWTCYDGLPQQTWDRNSYNGTISTANNQCLNVAKENSSKLQTWQCSPNAGDPQEFFILRAGSGGSGDVTNTFSALPTTTGVTSPPVGTFTATQV